MEEDGTVKMSLKLMYITNDPEVATIAENAGVDRIWIDLEWIGKEERQQGMDTVKSNHKIEDVGKLRPYVKKAELMVRVNPIYDGTKNEIDRVINNGADLIMLPMFKTVDEAKFFVNLVNGRAKVMLLVETKEAFSNLQEIVKISGIDEIHIGLNDLHLSYGMKFMFELLSNGMVENACRIMSESNKVYGFGGIARLGKGMLPAEKIIAEHYRLGSSMAILSRSFCDDCSLGRNDELKKIFNEGISDIRNYEKYISEQDESFFEKNKSEVKTIVESIVKGI